MKLKLSAIILLSSSFISFAGGAGLVTGTLSANPSSGGGTYTLPIATTSTLGGIKPDGTTITVDGSGVATVVGGGVPTIVALIPTMTANTTPYGIASASSIAGAGNDAWKSMDGNTGTFWSPSGSVATNWVQYQLTNAAVVSSYTVTLFATKSFLFQASSDGANFITLDAESTTGGTFSINNSTAWLYYRLTTTTASPAVEVLQINGYYATPVQVGIPNIPGFTNAVQSLATGATLPNTLNLISGNGSGGASDSKIAISSGGFGLYVTNTDGSVLKYGGINEMGIGSFDDFGGSRGTYIQWTGGQAGSYFRESQLTSFKFWMTEGNRYGPNYENMVFAGNWAISDFLKPDSFDEGDDRNAGAQVSTYIPSIGGSGGAIGDLPVNPKVLWKGQIKPYLIMTTRGSDSVPYPICTSSNMWKQINTLRISGVMTNYFNSGIGIAYHLENYWLTNRDANGLIQWDTNRFPEAGTSYITATNVAYDVHTNGLELWVMNYCIAQSETNNLTEIDGSISGNGGYNFIPSGPLQLSNQDIRVYTTARSAHRDISTDYYWGIDGASFQDGLFYEAGDFLQTKRILDNAILYPFPLVNDYGADTAWGTIQYGPSSKAFYGLRSLHNTVMKLNIMYSRVNDNIPPELENDCNGWMVGSNAQSPEPNGSTPSGICDSIGAIRNYLLFVTNCSPGTSIPIMQTDPLAVMSSSPTAWSTNDWQSHLAMVALLGADLWVTSPQTNFLGNSFVVNLFTNSNFKSIWQDSSRNIPQFFINATNGFISKQLTLVPAQQQSWAVLMENESQTVTTNLMFNFSLLNIPTNTVCSIFDVWTNTAGTFIGNFTNNFISAITPNNSKFIVIQPLPISADVNAGLNSITNLGSVGALNIYGGGTHITNTAFSSLLASDPVQGVNWALPSGTGLYVPGGIAGMEAAGDILASDLIKVSALNASVPNFRAARGGSWAILANRTLAPTITEFNSTAGGMLWNSNGQWFVSGTLNASTIYTFPLLSSQGTNIVSTFIQTNFVSNQIYNNLTGVKETVYSDEFIVSAALGNTGFRLLYDPSGGTAWQTNDDGVTVQVAASIVGMTNPERLVGPIPAGASFVWSNFSTVGSATLRNGFITVP